MRVCSLRWTLLLLLPPAIAQADGLVDRLPDTPW